MRRLMPHQRQALSYAKPHSSIALFMEMRLGKTLVAIRWARFRWCKKILVVAPLSVLPGWVEELKKEGVKERTIGVLLGKAKTRLKQATQACGWCLVNYEGLRSCPELLDLDWDGIILDESTRIKNPQAQITKLILKKTPTIINRAVLSGLPAPESPLDYFSQFAFLHEKFMGCPNYWAFRQRYFNQIGFDWIPYLKTHAEIKKEVHRLAFVRTRKQVNIGSKKIYERRYVEPNSEQLGLLKQIKREYAYTYRNIEKQTMWVLTKVVWCSRIAGGFLPDNHVILNDAKYEEIVRLLKGELKGEKVVIWFRFNQELEHVVHRLRLEEFKVGRITGDTAPHMRKIQTDLFQKGNTQVLCIQIQCGKFGVDFSASSTCIYYSNSYSMEDRAQSEDRILHPTKKEPLLYIDLVTRNTIDEDALNTLLEKKINSRMFMTALVDKWKRRYGLKSRLKIKVKKKGG